jgi:hypothetical protein
MAEPALRSASGHVCPLMDKAMMVRKLGPETNMVWMVRELSGCRNRNKVANMCRVVPIL